MKFVVLNRESAQIFNCEQPYIHICISDPQETEPILVNTKHRIGRLNLWFHDWDKEAKEYFNKKYQNSSLANKQVFFTRENANNIISFVRSHLDKVNLIVVNCEAGISRSAAVAAALSKCINGDDLEFFRKYIPNSLVYSTIMEVWHE